MKTSRLIVWLLLFSIAMAFLESAVVVYIRELLYPDGFKFPLEVLNPSIAFTEIIREAATLIMLAGAGVIAGKTFSQRFAWFIFCFAVWDIFYYIFLKLLIGWPSSLLDWDVLFLIPVTWTGPVISPIIVSLVMIVLASTIVWFSRRGVNTRIHSLEWILLISGAFILIISFAWDYSAFILNHYSFSELWNLPGREAIFELGARYMPLKFNWIVFTIGNTTIAIAIVRYYKRLASMQT